MKRIKNYLFATIIALAPSLLLAHPGHEHYGTGMESHFLVSIVLVLALGAGAYYFFRKKDPASNNRR